MAWCRGGRQNHRVYGPPGSRHHPHLEKKKKEEEVMYMMRRGAWLVQTSHKEPSLANNESCNSWTDMHRGFNNKPAKYLNA